jgi:hypothetical protein
LRTPVRACVAFTLLSNLSVGCAVFHAIEAHPAQTIREMVDDGIAARS